MSAFSLTKGVKKPCKLTNTMLYRVILKVRTYMCMAQVHIIHDTSPVTCMDEVTNLMSAVMGT